MLDPNRDLQGSSDEESNSRRKRTSRGSGAGGSGSLLGAGMESPEFTSPYGSPRDEDGPLSAKGRFLELKRLMQDDLDSSFKPPRSSKDRKSRKPKGEDKEDEDEEDFEEVGDDWSREGSISPGSYHDDVEELLQSFRAERAYESTSVSQRLENHPKMVEVCQQLRDRDIKIINLESKVMELDRKVIDMQDTLSERDKLLNSKNEAFNCMKNQYQQEIAEKNSELTKTQETLFELEKKFGAAQEQWKTEKERLNNELKQQTTRLKDLEDTNKMLEEARLEITSRDLNLEEKLTVLKEDRDRLTKENAAIQKQLDSLAEEKLSSESNVQRKTEEYETNMQQLKASLDKSTEQMTKLKQQFQAKLKSLKDQLKETTNQADSKVELEMAQKKITELETDLQNSTVKVENLQAAIIDLEHQLLSVRSDRSEDPEKESLSAKVTELNLKLVELEGSYIIAQEEALQVRNEKDKMEREFLERLGEFEKNFTDSMNDYENKFEETEKTLATKDLKLKEDEEKIKELSGSLEKAKEQLVKMKRQFQAKLKAVKEEQKDGAPAQSEGQSLEKVHALENRVAELEEEKGNNLWLQEELNQIKGERDSLQELYDSKVAEYEKRIEGMSQLLESSSEQIQNLEQQQHKIKAVTSSEQSEGWTNEDVIINDSEIELHKTRIESLENQVAQLEEEKGSGFLVEEEISKMKSDKESLEKRHQEQIAEYEARLEETHAALAKSNENLTKMKRQFQAKLKALREERKTESPTQPEVELQAKVVTLENRVAELEEEKGNLLLQMVDYDEQQVSRSSGTDGQDVTSLQEQTIKLEMGLAEKEEELRILQHQLNEMATALSQKNVEVEQLMKNCSDMQQSLQQKVDDLSGSVNSKEEEVRRVIQEYEEDNRTAHARVAQLEQQILENSKQLIMKESEAQETIDKLAQADNQLKEMSSLVSQYEGLLGDKKDEDQGQLATLQQELEAIMNKAAQAEKTFETMKATFTDESNLHMKTIHDLQEELNKRILELTVKDTACNELTKETIELQEKVHQLEHQILERESKFKTEIDELKTSIAIYQVQVDQSESLRHLQDELSQQVAAKDAEIESMYLKVNEMSQEVAELNTKLENMKNVADSANSSVLEISSERDTIGRELQSVRDHYANFETIYNQMYVEFNQKSQQLEEILQSGNQSSSAIEELQSQISEKNTLLEEYNNRVTTLEDEKSRLCVQLDVVSEEKDDIQNRLSALTSDYARLREKLESADLETQRLREDANTLQIEYADSTNELKLKISTLMDQLNDCENEISVMSSRLKESDNSSDDVKVQLEQTSRALEEKNQLLEEKIKSLEAAENSLFEKTEEAVKLEERFREVEEKHNRALEDNYVKYSSEVEQTFEKYLAATNDNSTLQDKIRQREMELQEARNQLQAVSSQISIQESYVADQSEKIFGLENQLSLVSRQFEEVRSNEARELQKVSILETQLAEKQLRVQELSVELEEVRSLRMSSGGFVSSSLQQSQPVDSMQEVQLSGNLAEDVEERDRRIYELEVQLAELQICVDDANIQLQEVTELRTTIDVLSYRLKEAETENEKLKKELENLKSERAKNIQRLLDLEAISGPSIPAIPSAPSLPPVPVNEEVIRATAYTTTDTSIPVSQEANQQASASEVQQNQYDNALKEIKELKVKNGKMIQRFKQLKDKYDAVVKEYDAFKSKKDFSLDSTLEDEVLSQIKQKDKLLEDKGKQLSEIMTENQRLTEKLDLLERGTDRLTEMKEDQDRTVQELVNQKRTLETEVSALKWKIEELENISLNQAVPHQTEGKEITTDTTGYFDVTTTDQAVVENNSLRQQNSIMSQELHVLQAEIQSCKKAIDELNERNQQLEEEYEKLQELQIEQHHNREHSFIQPNLSQAYPQPTVYPGQENQPFVPPTQPTYNHPATEQPYYYPQVPESQSMQQFDSVLSTSTVESAVPLQSQSAQVGATENVPVSSFAASNPQELDIRIVSLQQLLQTEQQEKSILGLKIELLQQKISEIEVSEMKCFEESLMLKSWTRQLELDNLKMQSELDRILSSINDGDTGNLKAKVLQDEVLRLVDALHDRDRRCEELTLEITRLLEERDTLQLKLSGSLRHNVSLHEEANKGSEFSSEGLLPYDTEALRMKLAELQHMTYTMEIDLKREREARRLVQEQLFFSSASRIYPVNTKRQTYSPSRTTPTPSPSPPSASSQVSYQQQQLPSTPTQHQQGHQLPPLSTSPNQVQTSFQATPQHTDSQLFPSEPMDPVGRTGGVSNTSPASTVNI